MLFGSSLAVGPDALFSLTKWVHGPREHKLVFQMLLNTTVNELGRGGNPSVSHSHRPNSQCLLEAAQQIPECLGYGQPASTWWRPPESALPFVTACFPWALPSPHPLPLGLSPVTDLVSSHNTHYILFSPGSNSLLIKQAASYLSISRFTHKLRKQNRSHGRVWIWGKQEWLHDKLLGTGPLWFRRISVVTAYNSAFRGDVNSNHQAVFGRGWVLRQFQQPPTTVYSLYERWKRQGSLDSSNTHPPLKHTHTQFFWAHY